VSIYERGVPTVYEVTWMSGHVERIKAHQVSWPNSLALLSGGAPAPPRVQMHAEIEGRWTLQLDALMDDIRTIRNLATEEVSS
jgi:hypothetical protein